MQLGVVGEVVGTTAPAPAVPTATTVDVNIDSGSGTLPGRSGPAAADKDIAPPAAPAAPIGDGGVGALRPFKTPAEANTIIEYVKSTGRDVTTAQVAAADTDGDGMLSNAEVSALASTGTANGRTAQTSTPSAEGRCHACTAVDCAERMS